MVIVAGAMRTVVPLCVDNGPDRECVGSVFADFDHVRAGTGGDRAVTDDHASIRFAL